MGPKGVTTREVKTKIVGPEIVGAYMRGMEHLDPRGLLTADDIEAIGLGKTCLEIEVTRKTSCTDGSHHGSVSLGFLVLSIENGLAWIDAAKGEGDGLTQAMHDEAVKFARAHGCTGIGCQTARPGLRKLLEGIGWKTTGYVLQFNKVNTDD